MLTYSVIIPIYKMEQYLSECVDSVLAQDTTSPYEIILVDDESPDNCGAICDDYAAKHENIRVIHQKNKGLSGARNSGLAIAQGEYILFLDSDDLWQPNLLSTMDTFLPKKPDMVLFSYERFNELGETWQVHPPRLPQGERGDVYLQTVFQMEKLPFWAAWTYLYRRAFLAAHNFQFTQGLLYTEDMDFNLGCLPAAESVYGIDQILLRYRFRSDSISTAISGKGLMLHLQYDVKWFHTFSAAALANYYALEGLGIDAIQDAGERKSLTAYYFQNTDVLSRTTGKAKFAYLLLKRFGISAGTRIFRCFVQMKHLLHR